MAERNELRRPLGGHDPGDPGDRQRITLLECAAEDGVNRFGFGFEQGLSHCAATGRGLVADIDDMGFAGRVEMGQGRPLAHAVTFSPMSKVRVAAVTSGWRIRLSPTRKVPIPAVSSRRRSAWPRIPLSETRWTLEGTPAARF